MISRWFSRLRGIRRYFSRGERAAKLLRLPRTEATAAEPGLILIQIDGLSRAQFDKAVTRRRLPFIRRLLRREDYRLHTHYSGLPSTTPAVQGEIFYGVRCAVPSFQFRDARTGEVTWLLSAETASHLESELEKRGEPLLKGGTAYCDTYTGGARESSFCSSRLGWNDLWKRANPAALIVIMLMHSFVVVRMAFLVAIELGLALLDGARGVIARQGFPAELTFIPKRVALCILLREMISLGVRMDVARGVPVIHCNLIGYDEQAHRRGPDSAFAHWTLKGIDATIRGIWRAAARSNSRHYDIWIYSDHGQEKSLPYSALHGRDIRKVVAEVFERYGLADVTMSGAPDEIATHRTALLGGKRLQRLLRWPAARPEPVRVQAGGMGPVEHVYVGRGLPPEMRDELAADLVKHAQVPFVAVRAEDGTAGLWTSKGKLTLPRDAARIGWTGAFGKEITRDFIELTRHPDAGDFVLLGWKREGGTITFADEHGAHAGPGPHETQGFAMVPHDAPLDDRPGGFVRPVDIRHAAMRFLGRKAPEGSAARKTELQRIRIMTYNVHSCIGLDGRHAPERLARVISRYEPDVVALQELDVNRLRTEGVDQARRIAELLEMEYHFHPSFSVEEEQYGNAVLSMLPMRLVRAGPLPRMKSYEPRGAIWVEVSQNGRTVNLFNTHLGLRPDERKRQIRALLGSDWAGGPAGRAPVILCGDFNAGPGSQVHRAVSAELQDAQSGERRRRATWMRLVCYDYVFTSPEFRVHRTRVPRTHLTGVASDHLPVIVDLFLPD
jgi:endonuclease/exonuclease/phosphatase family metal-dependent hydrolase